MDYESLSGLGTRGEACRAEPLEQREQRTRAPWSKHGGERPGC